MMKLVVAYIRLLAFFAFTAIWMPIVMLAIVLVPGSFVYYQVAAPWITGLLKLFGATVVPHGLEKLRFDREYVILSNHRSQLDPPAIASLLLPRVTRWVAKKELRRVPILGQALQMSGQIFIDRGDPSAAVEELSRHTRDRGVIICFFPEGHRSSTYKLLPFKKGGAAFAISAGLPVVPVAISGSEIALPNHSIVSSPATIHVAFGDPIETSGMTADDRVALTERVRDEIQRMLQELDPHPQPVAAPKPAAAAA
ncbi:MAG TPA: lysophospholipid acyltransferase family protein [Candidatus Limnocylindrales bacterium]|nr:lysophospholipid acyltransferase family protein [Candidatus Limnocylindrales bacterium]